jgi:ribonuclease HI
MAGIGTAAVSLLGVDSAHIGDLSKQTVYAAELKGIKIILARLRRQPAPGTAVILTNNQAVIQACGSPKHSSSQHILCDIVRHLEALRGWDIRLQWIPGHVSVAGNKQANKLAKQASNPPPPHPEPDPDEAKPGKAAYPILKSAILQQLKASAKAAWKATWAGSERGAHTRLIIPKPTPVVLACHEGLRQAASSVLVQMQTRRISLGVYLSQFIKGVSTRCSCNLGV